MASELRRRVVTRGKKDDSISQPPEPVAPEPGESPVEPGDKVKLVHPKRKRNLTAIFLLGSVFGILAAGFFAKSNDLVAFPEIGEISVDSLLDALPAGLVKDVRDLVVCFAKSLQSNCGGDGLVF